MAAHKVSAAMFRMPFRREEEELGLVDWWCEHYRPLRWLTWVAPAPLLAVVKFDSKSQEKRCLSKRIIKSTDWVFFFFFERGCAPGFPYIPGVIYGQFREITDASWHRGYNQTDWLTLKTWGSVQQGSVKNTNVKT